MIFFIFIPWKWVSSYVNLGIYGAGPHTDYGFITVLATNDVPGLEIFLNNSWIPIQPIPGALIVNLGN